MMRVIDGTTLAIFLLLIGFQKVSEYYRKPKFELSYSREINVKGQKKAF